MKILKMITLAVMAVLTMNSMYAQTNAEGVKMNSFYTPTPDNPDDENAVVTGQHGLLTLETYITGAQVTTHTIQTKACDIILVLDESSSMNNNKISTVGYVEYKTSYKYSKSPDNLYYKDANGEYYALKRGGSKDKYYIYYKKEGNTIYLNTNGTTSKTKVEKSGSTVFTGTLYTNKITRLEALRNAVEVFVNQVQDNAAKNNVNHRISIVGFSSQTDARLLTLPAIKKYADNPTMNDYTNSLVPANVKADNNNVLNPQLVTAISRISYVQDTYPNYGMEMAVNVFAGNPIAANEERQRVVVIFTDGLPEEIDNENPAVPNAAIAYAYTLKNAYDATVYSIAIYEEANPNAPLVENATTKTDRMNKYMHYMSSNFAEAQNLFSPINTPATGGYYMVATDAEQLQNIFSQIAVNKITGGASNTTVTETSVSKGVLSAYFKLPENISTEDIKVYVARCINKNDAPSTDFDSLAFTEYLFPENEGFNNIKVAFDKAQKYVSVTGFNYSDNWCGVATNNEDPNHKANSTAYRGYKLVLVFPVEIDEAGLNMLWKNGNHFAGMPINSEASGLYAGETGEMIAPYKVFEQTVNSPLPVELLSFHAECIDHAIQFTWSTATETNNEYFTLESSEDAVNYKEIARIQGAGTSAYRQNYSFMADNNTNRTMYYRLRQTDIDGTTVTFDPIAVQCNVQVNEITLFPMPAKDYVTLQSTNDMENIMLYNMCGAVVYNMQVNANTATIDLTSLANGIYMTCITLANGEHITKKIIKR